ncbi:cation diffusion facilitator family transporter [Faunimonas pinastri]|uniref:Cation diffusion facilitator family transporter n=1 Tax=Faunimonas pinastri TaxID=1855383 RepID=A0A1H9JP09_9HYPH|nr:cation diffusion facilitator family transporter [Faunimonas pinastri]SEQ88519.1 cation diffusion facilitator family transporter [Faunimonas pinastri]
MSAHASKRALFAALAANAGIAVAKFAGAAYTGSSAMASEGIHSLVDTGNQLLLLFGMKDSSRPADASHPFGYGLRLYFWGFVVAMAVFALGSGVAIYEGAEKVAHPQPIENAWVNCAILIFAMLLEGSSLLVAMREVREECRRRGTALFETIRTHRDPTIFAVVYEETAALAGLVAALVGVILAVVLDKPALDGWTSIVIGLILAATSLSLARQCYVLMTGTAADPTIEERLREILARVKCIEHVNEVRTMHFGPSEVLVLVSADFANDTLAGTVETIVSDVEDGIREEFPEVRRVYIEAQSSTRHVEALEDIGEDVDALEREEDEEAA